MSTLKLDNCKSYKTLVSLRSKLKNQKLSTLLADHERCDKFIKTYKGITLDLSRELLTQESFDLLVSLCGELKVKEKTMALFNGDVINLSENRPVLHTALRLPRNEEFHLGGQNVTRDVYAVLDMIKNFSEDVRSGKILASDGKPFDSFLCIGIGGSFLGSLFTIEAFMGYPPARESSKNIKVRFLSNIDPASLRAVTSELDPNRTMAIITSKTFTTMETIKNGHSVRQWLLDNIEKPELIGNHLCAISTNVKLASEFGVDPHRIFPFWDWVGGRFSVCSAVGIVPLSLVFGFDMVEMLLQGCHDMDLHFKNTPIEDNLPFLMALTCFFNSTILGYNVVALLPYSHDLSKFPQYAQQLIMESNGKSVSIDADVLTYETSEIYFGECGTNGQHSFYQMLHQGRTVPCEFIGFINSFNKDNKLFSRVNHHVELICNLFGQLDGLAFGKCPEKMIKQGFDEKTARNKMSDGNRPSMLLLFDELTPYTVGQLISLYEHRTAVQGFLWDINSFDQMGVELGKELANNLRSLFQKGTTDFSNEEDLGTVSYSTTVLLQAFLKKYKPIS